MTGVGSFPNDENEFSDVFDFEKLFSKAYKITGNESKLFKAYDLHIKFYNQINDLNQINGLRSINKEISNQKLLNYQHYSKGVKIEKIKYSNQINDKEKTIKFFMKENEILENYKIEKDAEIMNLNTKILSIEDELESKEIEIKKLKNMSNYKFLDQLKCPISLGKNTKLFFETNN